MSRTFVTQEEVFRLARSLSAPYTQAEIVALIAEKTGATVTQQSVSKMLKGEAKMIKLALTFVDAVLSPDQSLERSPDGEPVTYFCLRRPK